jgi:pyruvate/2-oxoglutarate dehydrogenase complex dihydrolipoamide acyltransferase (E2) component
VLRVKGRHGGRAGGRAAKAPQGSGPGGRITPEDVRAKAQSLVAGVEGQVQAAKPTLTYLAVGGVLLIAFTAFWLGKRSGRVRSTLVEVRRE